MLTAVKVWHAPTSLGRMRRLAVVAALWVLGCGRDAPLTALLPAAGPAPAERCPVAVTTSHTGEGTGALAFDGDVNTGFVSSHLDWQFLHIDFGCEGRFRGLRRLLISKVMGRANRGPQGEGVATSLDGQTWTALTAATSTGWEGAVAYAPTAWHSLPTGWTPFLRPTGDVRARYVRFNWDGDGDSLREVEVEFVAGP
jgi:hypothetical protein